jgi:hypothetical protein
MILAPLQIVGKHSDDSTLMDRVGRIHLQSRSLIAKEPVATAWLYICLTKEREKQVRRLRIWVAQQYFANSIHCIPEMIANGTSLAYQTSITEFGGVQWLVANTSLKVPISSVGTEWWCVFLYALAGYMAAVNTHCAHMPGNLTAELTLDFFPDLHRVLGKSTAMMLQPHSKSIPDQDSYDGDEEEEEDSCNG